MRGSVLRKVMLNHAIEHGKQSTGSIIVLGLGVVSICLALYQMQSLGTARQKLKAELALLQHPQADRPSKALTNRLLTAKPKQKDEEEATSAEIMQQLALPWEPLFSALENINTLNIAGAHVRLLAVEPNPGRHQLRLTAEATSTDAMLDYVKELSEQGMLKQVLLETHEQTHDGRVMPISFEIEAIWQM